MRVRRTRENAYFSIDGRVKRYCEGVGHDRLAMKGVEADAIWERVTDEQQQVVTVTKTGRKSFVLGGNGIEQVRLNNVRVRSIEGTGKQGELIKVKGEKK